MIRTTLTAIVFLVGLGACDNADQVDFRTAAGAVPAGIFRTDDGITPLNGENDPDDWRTAPVYATTGFVVNRRAHPNPANLAQAEIVTLEFTTADRIPGGLQLVAVDGFGGRSVLSPIMGIPGAGIYNFTFFVGEIQGADAGELWRLIVFDSNGEPVTYGDLLIE